MLLEEFIKPLGLTQRALAEKLGMSRVAVNEIVNSRRSITPGTALRLARAFGTTPEFWLNGQLAIDLYMAQHDEEQLRAHFQTDRVRSPQPTRPVTRLTHACGSFCVIGRAD
jgi:addiction module HigA family antidote